MEPLLYFAFNRPISVYRLCEMPIQSCGQSVSARRGKRYTEIGLLQLAPLHTGRRISPRLPRRILINTAKQYTERGRESERRGRDGERLRETEREKERDIITRERGRIRRLRVYKRCPAGTIIRDDPENALCTTRRHQNMTLSTT
jgi:hypothetical protein